MVREVDLRSDTVTKPTPAMRKAMAEAVVGDDVYKEDPTLNELERRIAELLGKEDALFVPSGTMGNLAAVMAHCWTRGEEALIGDQSHIFMYEQGGVSQLGGVLVSAIPTKEDGTFDLGILESKIRLPSEDSHEPITRLICLENTHNRCGGKVLPVSYIEKVCELANKHGVLVHMDGARIINASVTLGVPPKDIVKNCASVSMCLSKAIGAPVGSVVAGTKDFIKRCRKVLGGAMRQAGVLAAAALVALDTAEERLRIDHKRAKKLAQDIKNLKSELITIDPDAVQSNMLLLCFPSDRLTSEQFVQRMAEVRDQDDEKVVVKVSPRSLNRVRCVLHSDISQEDLDCAFRKIRVGQITQPNLFTILIRFRTNPIAFTADIQQIYRQILIAPEDQDLQRIIWRESAYSAIKVRDRDDEKVVVKACEWFFNRVRCVLHSDLSQEDLDCAFRKIRSIAY